MTLFDTLISKTIMYVPGSIVGIFARSYIAGEHLSDAIRVARELNKQSIMATIDILGEFITRLDEATYFKDQCIDILEAIEREGLDANLSLKPTQMGMLLDKEAAFANIREIVERAAELNNFVRIDMEDIECTDDTIDFFRRLREEFPGHVGIVLQAYLLRTPKDIDGMADAPLNVRLCKGIYDEPRSAAWKLPDVVNRSFTWCLERLLKQGAYVGIATHDSRLVFEATKLIHDASLAPEQYEFQMLLGVDEELRRIILEQGHRLRVYVPYGESWLPYSKRRLKENPSIARHALKQLLGGKG